MLLLIEQIKSSKENNKHLSDEQRKQNAELIMMKLAEFMNLDDD